VTISQKALVKCGECGALMELRDSRYGKFYGCTRFPECRGTHGAHENGKPLGVPTNKETRLKRIETHKVFDQLWKTGYMSRGEAYRALAIKLGRREVHIGEADLTDCSLITAAALELLEGLK
jgi:ssDNA-binding Zn-finger/Zn-ribbon topoisomerase 1